MNNMSTHNTSFVLINDPLLEKCVRYMSFRFVYYLLNTDEGSINNDLELTDLRDFAFHLLQGIQNNAPISNLAMEYIEEELSCYLFTSDKDYSKDDKIAFRFALKSLVQNTKTDFEKLWSYIEPLFAEHQSNYIYCDDDEFDNN